MSGLLLDQGLPRSTAGLLNNFGFAAIHVGELRMAQASDSQILDYGRANHMIVVTLDADFHLILAATRALFPSVIRIRQQGVKADEAARIIRTVMEHGQAILESGAVASVRADLVRFKRLPIGKRAT